MGSATPPVDYLIRLADEGVPLRAIARAIDIPSESVRDCLYQAKNDGRLVDLPCEDWPPGCPRDARALQLSRLAITDKLAVTQAVAKLFGLTATETRLLLALIHWQSLARERIALPEKALDVHIHYLRDKLVAFNITIETLWGYGYQLSTENRQTLTKMILEHVSALPSL